MKTSKLVSIAELSARWHGGQWSRLYRIGCRAHTLLKKRGILTPLDIMCNPGTRTPFRRQVCRHYKRLLKAAKNAGEI